MLTGIAARRLRPWHVAMAVTGLGLVLTAYMAAPLLVTFDGHFYLVGSEVLFTPEAPDQYWWLRLPGYSIFLYLVREVFGPSDVALTLAQATAMVAGSCLIAYVGMRQFAPRRQGQAVLIVTGTLLLGCGSAGVLMYASAVLQQALFLLSISLVVFVSWRFRTNRSIWWLVGLAVILCLLAQVQKEFAYVALCAFVGIEVAGRRGDLVTERRLSGGAPRRLVNAAAIGVVGVLLINLSLLPWGHYRDRETARRSAAAPVLQQGFPSIADQVAAAASLREPHPWGFASQLIALAGFQGGTIFATKPIERNVYIAKRFSDPGYPCGAVEDLPLGLERQFAISSTAIRPSCRPWATSGLVRSYVTSTLWLYPWVLLIGVVLAAARLFLSRRRHVEIALLVVIASYVVTGFGADRYSVPVVPMAACVIILTLIDCIIFLGRVVSRETAACRPS